MFWFRWKAPKVIQSAKWAKLRWCGYRRGLAPPEILLKHSVGCTDSDVAAKSRPSWCEFLRVQACAIVATDHFTVVILVKCLRGA